MFYEDVVTNPEPQIDELAVFLGKAKSKENAALLAERACFCHMKKNKATNIDGPWCARGFEFVRKGKVGDWRNYFTVEQNQWMDARLEEKLGGTGLVFQYE